MKALEINQLMINIESEIKMLEHKLTIPWGGRLDRANFTNGSINERIDALNRSWDELELQFAN
jgi:hypothetical protein